MMTLGQIAQLLDGHCAGNAKKTITGLGKIEAATKDELTFLANPKYLKFLEHSTAGGILVAKDFHTADYPNLDFITVDDPYLAFSTLLAHFQRAAGQAKSGLETPHSVGKNVKWGAEVYIGAMAYLGDDVALGNHVKIHPQAYIGDGCVIGDHSIIYPGAKLYPGTHVGSYCNIHAGAVIGSHGFGFAPQPDGSYQNIPQTGNVVLGNHVDIGANTTIDCATVGSTVIADGVKIDNLVQVAHNVSIDMHTVIAAQTGISGSAKVGKYVKIGGQVGTVGHITIADHTTVGARSGVTKNTKSDQILFGVPAIDRHNYLKSYAVYKKLPELMSRIEHLEQKLLNLTSGKTSK
ncbi:UDP-3-O-(3-hydroxymyristoyl)glucosamine N-acyltransferase [Marinoscillum furvescens]|uniref:UDP-3-O-acylglucosamine N-acyltransferase n=1 Tax=Marinoscillum furvescens DSM 4134 TaxID=1122208 RepID=A0A3D9L7F5_MARFU|nr:UDP-3-O-(3-hydroxymyristoyl)glucosamine N-acyltransferase [Marinoscillum furvescens]REE01240.1 UDP-3-O-[3-hydroxymyristoyl] glucosamine N-acyltransferase [Marinoscillum furvescens DSM 4134]